MTAESPFEGELIRLRAREPEDEPLSYQWFNDPVVTEFLTLRYPLSHRSEREFLEAQGQPGYRNASFSIVKRDGDSLIGGCSLEAASPENRSAVLGIAIGDKSYWDGGYGTDAMRVLCRFGFEQMNLHRIQLDVYQGNDRARHVYEKVGFRVEARRRQAHYKYGRYQDIYVMGLLEGELV
ncbi:MAG TPA: GNAT family protein [Tepidiformaceae bacterium]|nr:GNAT family protein [Tepidiformaceae bacterium]